MNYESGACFLRQNAKMPRLWLWALGSGIIQESATATATEQLSIERQ
jgi:hypothetical protein